MASSLPSSQQRRLKVLRRTKNSMLQEAALPQRLNGDWSNCTYSGFTATHMIRPKQDKGERKLGKAGRRLGQIEPAIRRHGDDVSRLLRCERREACIGAKCQRRACSIGWANQ